MGAKTKNPWTPGPWTVAEGGGNYLWEVRAQNETARARRTIARPSGPDRHANARLIAAAPDLAEALQPFIREAEAMLALGLTLNDETPVVLSVPSSALRKARLALSRARGKTE